MDNVVSQGTPRYHQPLEVDTKPIPIETPYVAYKNERESNNTTNNTPEAQWKWWRWLQTMDGIVAVAYFCNVLARALPILLVPIAVEEEVVENSSSTTNDDDTDDYFQQSTNKQIAAQVAHITSMAFTGGMLGKFVNGFVCQRLGAYGSSRWYMAGLAACSLAFSVSTTPGTMGLAYAGMEFCSSIQYGALAVMITTYYTSTTHNHLQMAAALTALGLASTAGEILAKIVGTFLAGAHHWRIVAKAGAGMALMGSLILSKAPGQSALKSRQQHGQQRASCGQTVVLAARSIMGKRLFWILALSYAMVFVCACSDRILVSYYYEMTHLPHNLCGGLTLSVTVGLVHGLISGSQTYTTLHQLEEKLSFLRIRYVGNIACTLGLVGLSYYGPLFITVDPTLIRRIVVATGIFLLSAGMASSIAFQLYQLPAMIAQEFADHKAVCISWLDGIGYMSSIPIFRALVWLVPRHGWSEGWGMLSILFALGGLTMLHAIGPVVNTSHFYEDDEHKLQKEPWRFFDWAFNVYDTVIPDQPCYGTEFMTKRYMPETPVVYDGNPHYNTSKYSLESASQSNSTSKHSLESAPPETMSRQFT